MSQEELYKNRYERERSARKQAEKLLEEKSYELYQTNQALEKLNADLEEQVVQRTSALKEAKDDLEMIAYIASHDLKTPLRSISHISNWIEEDIYSGSYDELSDYSSLLRTRVARIEALLDSLIEYTNLNSINTITTGLDTKALVLSILHREQEENQFKYAITGDFPVMDTVPKLLEKVFRNLIRNGFTYNYKPEKELKIHARTLPSGLIEFSVADNGNGIEKRGRAPI